MHTTGKLVSLFSLVFILFSFMPMQTAQAASQTVFNTNDSGAGSLRQVIADAAAGDTIVFDSSLSGSTITLASTLELTKNVTIDGSALTSPITISGNSTVGVFSVNSGITVILDNLIITNGYYPYGGGINNKGTLTVDNSTFSSNLSGDDGGGIYNEGTLTVDHSTFSGNSASFDGGGINNTGTLTVDNSTFSGNLSGFEGGGISNASTGTLTVDNSTFSSNLSGDGGGGISNWGTLTVDSSTFSSNSARRGGGISNWGTLTVDSSTFFGNSASHVGGGISTIGTLYYRNTIIANSPSGSDCYWGGGTIAVNSHNLVESHSNCGTPTVSSAPILGPLADNGGSTQTFALLSGSPAIDAGDDASCKASDQRGVTRPQGAACDIGAYESGASILTVTGTNPSTGVTLSSATSIKITFNEDPVTGSNNAKAVNNPGNYLLVERGDAIFDTQSCAGGVQTDDVLQTISLSSINYNPATLTATLTLASPLTTPGHYRLFICGTTSIWSAAGLELNNGLNDTTVDFTVQATTPSSLPATGFRHGRVTSLPEQPAAKAYTKTAMLLEIPKLGVSMPIVGVPQTENGWDTSWLGNSAGYLAGSAFPTWAGNTVITGHVWGADNQPGIFTELKSLKYGDQIQIQAWGKTYTYEVRQNKLVTAGNTKAVLQHEELDWVTLLTCDSYNPNTQTYSFRRAVRAVLVKVE